MFDPIQSRDIDPTRDAALGDPAAARAEARQAISEKWAAKSAATLVDADEFTALKEKQGLYVVGVTGFSGQWSQAKIDGDAGLASDVAAGRAALESVLSALKAKHGDKLVVSSGATMEGVPKLIYEACEKLGIAAMGVISEKAYDYELGKMEYLIVQGTDWGQESATFLASSDELLMMGGGGQAKREAIAAGEAGKRVTIFQGYKGTADQLGAGDVKGAVFLARH